MDTKPPPYLREMLLSQGNAYALLGSLALGAVLSIPYGFGVGAIPLIAFAAAETIAALYVPALPTFRARIDRRYRRRAREATRAHLRAEIDKRDEERWGKTGGSLAAYQRLVERVASLYKAAEDKRTELSLEDVERLDDATVDYLSMWLAAMVIDDRARAVDLAEIQQRIDAIDRQIEAAKPGADPRQLVKARGDYAALLARHRRMLSRKTALEAAMLSMPDQLEEIYQTIVTAPAASGMGAKLEDAIARLRLEEEIESELAGDLSEAVPELSARIEARPAAPRRLAAARAEMR